MRNKLCTCLVSFVFLFSFPVNAKENCQESLTLEPRDITGIERFLQANQFKSLDCFIAGLPDEVKALRSFVKKSLSLQEASENYPRAIVASPDGGFVLTFNGHPNQKGYRQIEILALDRARGPESWITAVVQDSGNGLTLTKNPRQCIACHGDPVRPIWNTYPSWPNMYGSVDDFLPNVRDPKMSSPYFDKDRISSDPNQEARLSDGLLEMAKQESTKFRNFRKSAAQHPRYHWLERVSLDHNPVYPYTEDYRTRNMANRPNLLIGTILSARHSEILYRRVSRNTNFQTFRSSVLHYYYCREGEQHIAHNTRLADRWSPSIAEQPILEIVGADETESYGLDSYLTLFGVKPHELTFQFAEGPFYKKVEEYNGFFSGQYEISFAMLGMLLESHTKNWKRRNDIHLTKDLTIEYAFRNSYIQSPFFSTNYSDQLAERSQSWKFFSSDSAESNLAYELLCQRLLANSKNEHKNNAQLTQMNRPSVAKPTEYSRPRALDSCIRCHDGPFRVANYIPFSNPQKLIKFNETFSSSYGFGNLADAVYLITDPSTASSIVNGHRMPLGLRPLNEKERQDIVNWLNSVVR